MWGIYAKGREVWISTCADHQALLALERSTGAHLVTHSDSQSDAEACAKRLANAKSHSYAGIR